MVSEINKIGQRIFRTGMTCSFCLRNARMSYLLGWAVVMGAMWAWPLCGLGDELVIRPEAGEANRRLNGNVLVEAADDSLLFQADDGRLWILKADQVVSRERSAAVVEPISQKEQLRRLEEELPGFRFHETDHFIIAYNTERAYAQWLGGLYEQLYRGFTGYWERKRKFKLDEPGFPLVVVVFASFEEYSAHVRRELGQDPGAMVAYYNLMTNRVTLYDLTKGFQGGGSKPDNDRKIQEILANPNALPLVATVVHEGTHQLMFNMGMQTRLADTPLWVNEGLAMFFETPDLNNPKGWRTIGQVNHVRLLAFRENLPQRAVGGESLRKLLIEDLEFRDPKLGLARYAEAWALNYFLLNKYSKEYVAYLEKLRGKLPLRTDEAETRVSEFESAIGKRLAELDEEFVEYMQKLRD
jgi:hypothetical protein